MRKVIVSEFVTLDGAVENPGGAEGFEHGEVGTPAAPTASGSLVASFPVGHSQPTSRQG